MELGGSSSSSRASDVLPPSDVLDSLMPKIPSVVVVSRKATLLQALTQLGQQLCEETTENIGDGIYVCTLRVGLPPHGSYVECTTKEFLGYSTFTCAQSVEHACELALSYLVDCGLIIIDDINYKKTKQLYEAQTWAMLFEEVADRLKTAVASTESLHRRLLDQINDMCADHSSRLALSSQPMVSVGQIDAPSMLSYTGPVPAKTWEQALGGYIAKIHEQILSFLTKQSKV
ncbi:hypothetical protein ACP70R_018277 [Stipagrostis hirtigluma subsp. patula]